MERSFLLSISALFLAFVSCSDDIHKGYRIDGYDLILEKQQIINHTKAVKSINPYDELACEIYDISNPDKEAGKAYLDYELGDDPKEGAGSFKLMYNFTGQSEDGTPEKVYFQQRWGDYRVDLSFHPLGLSIWVKGNRHNQNATFRFIIMEDEKQFSAEAPHDYTRRRWSYFAYEDTEILLKDGWTRLIMPYSAFKLYKKGEGTQSDTLLMNRNDEAERLLALPQAAQKAAWAFRQGSTSMIRLYPGALEMIEKLQEAGIVVALLSNAQSCYTRAELEMTGLASVLDDVIISSEEKIRKPARDLYMLALDREFVTAKHALMVGNDEKNDIVGARSAGIDGVYFRTEISPADDPDASSYAVRSFKGADYEGLLDYVLNA